MDLHVVGSQSTQKYKNSFQNLTNLELLILEILKTWQLFSL